MSAVIVGWAWRKTAVAAAMINLGSIRSWGHSIRQACSSGNSFSPVCNILSHTLSLQPHSYGDVYICYGMTRA